MRDQFVLPLAQARAINKHLHGREPIFAAVEAALLHFIADADEKRSANPSLVRSTSFADSYYRLNDSARIVLVHYNMTLVRWLRSGAPTVVVDETSWLPNSWLPKTWPRDITMDPDTLVVCHDVEGGGAWLATTPEEMILGRPKPMRVMDTLVATDAWGEAWLYVLDSKGKFTGNFAAQDLASLADGAMRLISCADGIEKEAVERVLGIVQAMRTGMVRRWEEQKSPIPSIYKR